MKSILRTLWYDCLFVWFRPRHYPCNLVPSAHVTFGQRQRTGYDTVAPGSIRQESSLTFFLQSPNLDKNGWFSDLNDLSSDLEMIKCVLFQTVDDTRWRSTFSCVCKIVWVFAIVYHKIPIFTRDSAKLKNDCGCADSFVCNCDWTWRSCKGNNDKTSHKTTTSERLLSNLKSTPYKRERPSFRARLFQSQLALIRGEL